MIAVIDYGAGNLQSVVKALNFIGCESVVTDKKEDILNADGAILPGGPSLCQGACTFHP